MAQFYEGGEEMFQALTYGEPHPGTLQFIQQQLAAPTQALSAATQEFIQSAQGLYDRFMGSEAMRTMRAAGRQLGAAWQSDVIRPLHTAGEFQQAPLVMQRYLMAEPHFRDLYNRQACDGYSETYIDRWPRVPGGEDHYDYRRVMQGIVQPQDDHWVAHQWVETLVPQDRELIAEEQFDILNSWSRMMTFLHSGDEDPTSRWNARL
jgi:hypothetical protein